MARGMVEVGAADHPGEQRGLAHVHLAHVLPEVDLGRPAHAVDRPTAVLAEVDLVEVGLEDLFLVVAPFQHHGHRHLAQLPDRGARGRQEEILGELLGERAAALHEPPGARVGQRGPGDPREIQAVVAEEALVLDGEHGVDEVGRRVVERDGDAVFPRSGERSQRLGLEGDRGKPLAAPVAYAPDPPVVSHLHDRDAARVEPGAEPERPPADDPRARSERVLAGPHSAAAHAAVPQPLERAVHGVAQDALVRSDHDGTGVERGGAVQPPGVDAGAQQGLDGEHERRRPKQAERRESSDAGAAVAERPGENGHDQPLPRGTARGFSGAGWRASRLDRDLKGRLRQVG